MIICGKVHTKEHHFNLRKRHYDPQFSKNARHTERLILQHSGLKLGEELHVYDVPIKFMGQDNIIHTFRCGDGNPEILVMIHGYGGNSVFYFPMLKDLAQKYQVYCIDLLGMGLSSKPEFPCQNAEETIEYFVESIEKWREAAGLEKQFVLAGHSFGGYMSAHYSMKYQNNVKKLLLISPAGVTKYEKDLTPEEYLSKMSWLKKKKAAYNQKYWDNLITPAEFFRKSHAFGRFVLKKYVKNHFGQYGRDETTNKLLYRFCSELLMDEKGSEMALFMILKPPVASAVIPLEDEIAKKMKIPVVIYYGDKDWMDQDGAHRLAKLGSLDVKVTVVKNSGHQMIIQSPRLITQEIIWDAQIMPQVRLDSPISH